MAEPVVAPEEPTTEAVGNTVPDVTDAVSETSAPETTEEQPVEDVAEEAAASEQSEPPAAEDAPAEESEATMPPDVTAAPEPISEAGTEEPEAEELDSSTDVAQPVDASRDIVQPTVDVAADPVVESPTDVPAEEDEAGPTAPEEETQADETPKKIQMADAPAGAEPSSDDEALVTSDVAEVAEDTETEHTTDAPAEEIPAPPQPDMASAGGCSFHRRCKFHILIAIVLGSVQFHSVSENEIVVRALNLLCPLFQVRQKNQRWQSPSSTPRNPRRKQWATPCLTLPTPCRKLRLQRPRRISQWGTLQKKLPLASSVSHLPRKPLLRRNPKQPYRRT